MSFFKYLFSKICPKHKRSQELQYKLDDTLRLLKTAEDFNKFYRIAIDKASIVAFTDPDGVITYANEMFCLISEYSEAELIGQNHRILKSEKMGDAFFKKMWETISSGRQWQGEICNRSKSGKEYWVDTVIVPFKDHQGHIERYIAIRRVITQEKIQQRELSRAYKDLAEAYKKAEQATKTKSDFLYTMSHEIRTPLNGIIGMTSILHETLLTAEQLECVETISNSGKILLTLINDILDLSKIEAGKMELEETEFNLCGYLKELIKPFQFSVQKKGIYLNLEFNDYPYNVFGDDGKIGQIVSNLLSNAVKFTKIGGITAKINLEALDKNTLIEITIKDTGIGIPEDAKDKMFHSFSQAERSTSRQFGGTGLGLSISKRLVEMMGGKISFESKYGEGTSFKVKLMLKTGKPIEVQMQKTCLNQSPNTTMSGRILVAEDNSVNQLVIARILDKWRCKYHIVANGNEVLKALKESEYDLILMDCQMPEMDGYDAARNVRQSAVFNPHIPIIALTANAVGGDSQKCFEAGMNEYLSKPIDRKALETVLRKYLNPMVS